MLRRAKDLPRSTCLHNLPTPHHSNAVRHLSHHRQIMRDKQHCQPMLPPQIVQQLQNLRLHCHIQSGRRLIGDQQPWPVHNRHRDQNPLPLPPRKLMRIVLRPPLNLRQTCSSQPDILHCRKHLCPHLGSAHRRMMRPYRLGNLRPHRHHRIQRRHRLLKDHGNLAPAPPTHRLFRQNQQLLSIKQHRPRNPGSIRQQPQHRQRSRRLPRPRLAHQPQRLARIDPERDTPHSFPPAKRNRQIPHIQQRRTLFHNPNTSRNLRAPVSNRCRQNIVPQIASKLLSRIMKSVFHRILVAAATLAASVASAQMHKVAKPEQVVRAVGVYEWTGDFAKPTASRLIPVSVYIEGKFEDAGVYTARPVPFALLNGNLYILQSAGIDKGTLDLAYAKHLQAVEPTGDLAYDDGWFGYGSVKPLSAPRNTTRALKPSKNVPVIATSSDPNRPHLVTKNSGDAASTNGDPSKPTGTSTTSQTTSQTTTQPDANSSGTKSTASNDDSDRPTMKRRDNSGSTSTASSNPNSTTASPPADDPDRPTMKRRDSSGSTSSGTDSSTTAGTQTGSTPTDDPDRPTMKRHDPSSGTTSSGSDTSDSSTASAPSTSPDDPDRPTLKRRSSADAQHAGAATGVPGVSAVGSLNDDPSRPNLHHGKPTSAMNETDLPKLTGLPPNLHQMVAVSDAVNRDPHPFTLAWDDEAQHQAILTKMQEMAQAQLAAYGKPPATAQPPATPAKKLPATQTRAKKPTPPPPRQPLLEEDLKAYTLSYGGSATYVYSANTGGTGAALRYVTIVAQDDGLGNIKPAIQSVTDAAHFDRTPKMQFVDVVDAEASNRASLLFELRSQSARQFALYRVIASHPEQIFLTGTTQ